MPVPAHLPVFSILTECDGPRPHTHRVLFSRNRAYSYAAVTGEDAPVIYLDGDLLSFDCTCERRGEPCMGRIEVDLQPEHAWTYDADSRRLLDQHGIEVTR